MIKDSMSTSDKGKEITSLSLVAMTNQIWNLSANELRNLKSLQRTKNLKSCHRCTFEPGLLVPRTPVVLKNQAFETFVLPVQRYGKNVLEKDVPVELMISARLPTGYERFLRRQRLWPFYGPKQSRKLSVNIKTQLLQLLASTSELDQHPVLNATSENV